MSYNGWTNYETWACKLWMDNDAGLYRYWGGAAQDAYDGAEACGTFSREENAASDLAEKIKEEIEGGADQAEGLYSDLLSAAISEINFHEIAASLIEDVDKEEEEEEEEDTADAGREGGAA